MTSTDQERIEWPKSAKALSEFCRITYEKALAEGEATPETRMAFLMGVAWATQELEAARRAPVVQNRPTVDQVSDAIGYHSSGWDCANPDELIDTVLRLAAAPQPPEAGLMSEIRTTKPEAAPVQLPEPEATVYSKLGTTCMFPSSVMRKGDKIYTERQVRQLLAAAK